MEALDVPLKPIVSEPELAVAWLAQRGLRPTKADRGRYTFEGVDGGSPLSFGAELLIVDNLGIRTDADLESARNRVEDHPRWPHD